ncbi:MAG: hypothetical protein AAF772_18315, partial [Acidobacteriota bacterium]
LEPLPPARDAAEDAERTAGWSWIFRAPAITLPELIEDGGYFFVGRHTGLFPYQPFALVALLLFLLRGGWRDPARWGIVAGLALTALSFLLWIPFNWHGGGGFVGNRYYVMAVPGFLWLVPRLGRLAPLAGYALAGALLGPWLLSPYGIVVPQPTLQAHVRGPLFQQLPFERSLREIPGYAGVVVDDVYVLGRKDQMRVILPDDGGTPTLWLQGDDRITLWLQSRTAIDAWQLALRGPAPGHSATVRLAIDGAVHATTLDGTAWSPPIVLTPTRAPRVVRDRQFSDYEVVFDVHVVRLEIALDGGVVPAWVGEDVRGFYRGAALRIAPAQPDLPDVTQ